MSDKLEGPSTYLFFSHRVSSVASGGGSIGGFIPASGAIPLKNSLYDPRVHAGVKSSGTVGTSGDPANRGACRFTGGSTSKAVCKTVPRAVAGVVS